MDSTETLLTLIRRLGTLAEFRSFLQDADIPHSGTWDTIINDRVRPALASGEIGTAELVGFLRDAEEYGQQHVFLYRKKEEGGLPSDAELSAWLQQRGAGAVRTAPIVVDLPEEPVLADARYEERPGGRTLVLKRVERREYVSLLRTEELGGGRFTREYQREDVRAVNVVRLHESGLLEVRIYRHRKGSRNYEQQLAEIWEFLSDLLARQDYTMVELVNAKQTLYAERHEREKEIWFTGTLMRADSGTTFAANCMRGRNLFADEDVEAGVATVCSNGNLYHDALNIWWLLQEGGRPAATVHMILAGQINEFAVPQRCNKEDYEHILDELLRLS